MKQLSVTRTLSALAMMAFIQIGAGCSPSGDGFKAASPSVTEGENGLRTEPPPSDEPFVTNDPNCVDPAPGTDPSAARFRVEVCALVNIERARLGLAPLVLTALHNSSAQGHAVDMIENDFFDHQGSDGRTPFQRMSAMGIQFVYGGENIAQGHRTSAEVVNAWMNSAGHRANILSDYYRRIGIGYYQRAWVQNFTN